MSSTGLAVLGLMRAKGYAEGLISNHYSKQYQPYPIVDNPQFTSKDVSVVCALLNAPQIFPECLKSWLRNNPKEIILVTICDCYDNVLAAIQSYNLTEDDRAKIKVIHVGVGVYGQRLQHAMGFSEVTGKIMAVTDDQILWSDHILESMLPCFEDAQVGAAGGPISVHIPPERRDPNIITPWEVAGTKYLFGGRGGGTAYWAADKWTWCLAGCTWLGRTAIFQDYEFIDSFIAELWNGRLLNSGGDNFITRYLHQHGHVIAVQHDDAATVWRTERNTLQSYWRFLREVPQTFRHSYVLYGTCNRLLRVPLGICHLAAWGHAGYYHSKCTLAYLAYCIWKQYPGYKKFFNAYPYMLTARNVGAAIACDYSWLVIGIWGLCTLSTDAWVHGDGNTAMKQPGVVILRERYGEEPADNATETHGGPLHGVSQNTGAGVLDAPGGSSVPVQEPVSISARRFDADANVNNEVSRIPTYQETLVIFDSLIQATEAKKSTGVQFPYKVPVTVVCADGNGGLRPVTAMIPCEEWAEYCVPNEDMEGASEEREEDENEKEE